MVIDILFCLLIGFNAVLGIKKGFIDAVFEFIDIGIGIFFALFFYFDLTVFLSSFLDVDTRWIFLISGLIYVKLGGILWNFGVLMILENLVFF